MTDFVLVLSTVADQDAGERIARMLVEERLAACVNLFGPMSSCYRWQGTVEVQEERQLVIKTTRQQLPALQARLATLHPYEVPECLVVTVAEASDAYGRWLRDAVS